MATGGQQYDLTRFINGVRQAVDRWRKLPESGWRVTPETARLLRHWRRHAFADVRPFFCQVEAVETVIWLTEVAPKLGREGASTSNTSPTPTAGPRPSTRSNSTASR